MEITMGYQLDGMGKEICDILRMAMIMMTGSLQQRFEQPKFMENGLEEDVFQNILRLLEEKKVREAENLMVNLLGRVCSAEDKHILHAALYFYQTLNEWDDGELEQADYSREEIQDGIQNVMGIYQRNMYG
ncbi:MAG: DUF6483 family protein [Ruminococcus flavefaciens]|nr:DUF6483 family protein [Ruminococcus flavefaciens]